MPTRSIGDCEPMRVRFVVGTVSRTPLDTRKLSCKRTLAALPPTTPRRLCCVKLLATFRVLRVFHCPLSGLAIRTTAFGSFLPVVTDRRMLLTDETLFVTIFANWKAFAGAMSQKVVGTASAMTLVLGRGVESHQPHQELFVIRHEVVKKIAHNQKHLRWSRRPS